MIDKLATKPKSAAVPDADFDQLPIEQKRAWLASYLAEGRAQLDAGHRVELASEADIEALFDSVRAEAHEKAGLKP